MENLETKSASVQSRRNFLKKAAYAAPAVIALGALSMPKNAHASCSGICLDNGTNLGTDEDSLNAFGDQLFGPGVK